MLLDGGDAEEAAGVRSEDRGVVGADADVECLARPHVQQAHTLAVGVA